MKIARWQKEQGKGKGRMTTREERNLIRQASPTQNDEELNRIDEQKLN